MKIGIMGGTFSPIHNAHLLIAEMAKDEYALDKVIFITDGNPPHKTAGIDPIHRFNMTRLAIEGNGSFTDDDFEITRTEKSYTVHTLEYLRKKYPYDKLYFIIGEDSLCEMEKWYMPENILKLAALLVFPRESQQTLNDAISYMKTIFDGEILPVHAPLFKISSTQIRQRIAGNKTVRYMIPQSVIDYIKENNLYE